MVGLRLLLERIARRRATTCAARCELRQISMVGDLLLSGLGKDRGLARCRACAAGVKGTRTAMQAYLCASACVAHGACTVAVEASAHCEGWPRPISSINQQKLTLFTTPRSRTGAPGPRVRRYKRHHAAQVRWQVPSRPEKCCYVSGWRWGGSAKVSSRGLRRALSRHSRARRAVSGRGHRQSHTHMRVPSLIRF